MDRLRALWDFEDLVATGQRLRAQLLDETSPSGRAEVLTQLARVQSLQDDFEGCEQLLQEAEALSDAGVAGIRIDLERGRKLRSRGDGAAAGELFERAYASARDIGELYLAGDAAHMAAISTADRMLEWTERGLELAESEPEAAYWAGPLLNNLGWHYFEAGEHEAALVTFERALEVRRRDPGNAIAIQWAQEAVDEARKALRR